MLLWKVMIDEFHVWNVSEEGSPCAFELDMWRQRYKMILGRDEWVFIF